MKLICLLTKGLNVRTDAGQLFSTALGIGGFQQAFYGICPKWGRGRWVNPCLEKF